MLVFISYRRVDWALAHRLQEQLQPYLEGQVYIDRHIHNDDFEKELLNKVRGCDVFVLIVTPATFNPERIHQPEDWIRREVGLAAQLEKPMVPILVEGIRLPAAGDLPAAVQEVTRKQGLKFYPEFFEDAVRKLAEHCVGLVPGARLIESESTGADAGSQTTNTFSGDARQYVVNANGASNSELVFGDKIIIGQDPKIDELKDRIAKLNAEIPELERKLEQARAQERIERDIKRHKSNMRLFGRSNKGQNQPAVSESQKVQHEIDEKLNLIAQYEREIAVLRQQGR